MGLTLHYELRLAPATPSDEVDRLIGELRTYAASLAFEHVTPVSSTGCVTRTRADAFIALFSRIIATPFEEDEPRTADPSTARGFVIDPGEGCEPASVAFLRRHDESGETDWFWRCSCKTQYASMHGEENFVACHTGLIAVLDRAKALGIEVMVVDESDYWDHRDAQQLVEEVRKMNFLMAKFAGALADRMRPNAVQATIFEHPRFEHLEMGEE